MIHSVLVWEDGLGRVGRSGRTDAMPSGSPGLTEVGPASRAGPAHDTRQGPECNKFFRSPPPEIPNLKPGQTPPLRMRELGFESWELRVGIYWGGDLAPDHRVRVSLHSLEITSSRFRISPITVV